jgi:hypothetical protein
LTISGWRPGHGELRDSEPMARLQISQSRHERGRGRISENRDQWALALDALSGKIPVAYVSITMHWCIRDSVGDPEGTSTSRLMSGGSCGGMRNAIAARIATAAMPASAVLVPPNFPDRIGRSMTP